MLTSIIPTFQRKVGGRKQKEDKERVLGSSSLYGYSYTPMLLPAQDGE